MSSFFLLLRRTAPTAVQPELRDRPYEKKGRILRWLNASCVVSNGGGTPRRPRRWPGFQCLVFDFRTVGTRGHREVILHTPGFEIKDVIGLIWGDNAWKRNLDHVQQVSGETNPGNWGRQKGNCGGEGEQRVHLLTHEGLHCASLAPGTCLGQNDRLLF
jgi:hypothetical protein